jgi:hypothetical protein
LGTYQLRGKMLKNKTTVELKIGERLYHFLCDADSPLGEIHDVLVQLKSYILQRMQEAQKAEQKPPES